ncbi:MAG: sugar phosphate isomerase/epimerase family protein [Actinocatenispora sp.]
MWTLSGFADEIDPDLDVQCRLLDELGIANMEFRSAWDTNVLDLDDAQLDRVRDTVARHGIRVSSIGSPIGKIGITEDFPSHLDRFRRALAVAERLEAPVVRVFSFFIPAGTDPDSYRDEVLRRMSAIADAARGHGVVLAHENEKEIYGDIPRRCADLVESVGSEQLRLTWDSANFVQCGVRPHTEGFELLRPYLEYVQIKDAVAATGKVVPAGAGDGEVRETLTALRDDGFDGVFSLEPHLGTVDGAVAHTGGELFSTAARAFTGLLDELHITYC